MAEFTRVAGTRSLELLPSLTGGPGGESFKRGGMEFTIAELPQIRQYMRGIAQRAYYRAWGILGNIRTAMTSFGDIEEWVDLSMQTGRIDSYIVLTDTKAGQKGAMSIEFGREPYYMTRDKSEGGGTYKVGGMTGKFILHRAFGVAPNSLHGTGGGGIP